jgi:photosystem II oxygen-evolving enhancer protein 3
LEDRKEGFPTSWDTYQGNYNSFEFNKLYHHEGRSLLLSHRLYRCFLPGELNQHFVETFAPRIPAKFCELNLSLQQSRRDAFVKIASGVAFVPVVANAAVGESPRFSVFGVLGDGTSYSEGAAYGSDQSTPTYSAYSVYGDGTGAIYDPSNPEFLARKKAVLAESRKRLTKLDGYIAKKEWFNVIDELDRYMYETRGAMKGLATTKDQQKAANAFFKAIEACNTSAALKKGDKASAAAADAIVKFDAFTASL